MQGRLLADRYRLVVPLGHGGMGTVWQAHDEMLDRVVAVKEFRFPPELSEAELDVLRQRTMREARTSARLSHPNVATVYDVLETFDVPGGPGRPWIVMEFVPSVSLADLVARQGPLPPPRVAGIGLQVLSALRAAHALRILHRDVKPGNVLLTEDGRAVLTDFGIATLEGDSSLTMSGRLLGSPGYIAPERARGHAAGPQSDLWSLGATLYTAVEGKPPYDRGGPLPTLAAVMTEDPDPPQRAGPLWPVLRQLLSKDPAQRIDAAQTEVLLREVAFGTPDTSPGAAAPGTPDVTAVTAGTASAPQTPGRAAPAGATGYRRRSLERTRLLPWLLPGSSPARRSGDTTVAAPVGGGRRRRLTVAASVVATMVAASVLVGWALLEADKKPPTRHPTAETSPAPTVSLPPSPSPTPSRAVTPAAKPPAGQNVGNTRDAQRGRNGGSSGTGNDKGNGGRGKGKDKKKR